MERPGEVVTRKEFERKTLARRHIRGLDHSLNTAIKKFARGFMRRHEEAAFRRDPAEARLPSSARRREAVGRSRPALRSSCHLR